MKKSVLITVIMVLLLPSALFAEKPSETEVQETTGVAVATFGLIFMTSLFGETPEGVKVTKDDMTEGMTISFNNFDIVAYYGMLSENEGSSAMMEEMPEIHFSRMTGKISVDEAGDMNLNLKLKGGNIKNLTLITSGDQLSEFTANGIDYSYIGFLTTEE